jgi:hypothetical protein
MAAIPAARMIASPMRIKMSIFTPNIQTLNSVFTAVYIVALVAGAVSSTGIIYCSTRLQRDANLKIAEANKSAALANERAEELEKENLQIRKDMADRFLTDDEKSALINLGGHGRVMTMTFIADREATDYARLLESAFKSGGWSVGRQYRQQYDPDPTPHGVICRVSKNPDQAVKAVITVLQTVRANPRIEEAPNSRPDFLDIVVGSKPKN